MLSQFAPVEGIETQIWRNWSRRSCCRNSRPLRALKLPVSPSHTHPDTSQFAPVEGIETIFLYPPMSTELSQFAPVEGIETEEFPCSSATYVVAIRARWGHWNISIWSNNTDVLVAIRARWGHWNPCYTQYGTCRIWSQFAPVEGIETLLSPPLRKQARVAIRARWGHWNKKWRYCEYWRYRSQFAPVEGIETFRSAK